MVQKKIRVGITGQSGFIGSHLYNTLGLSVDCFDRIEFDDSFFHADSELIKFVSQCDVIVHLAAVNRDSDPDLLYRTNLNLIKFLIDAMEKASVCPHVLFSSSIQEALDNPYGRSKMEGRKLFEEWAVRTGASFTGMIVPNVFGPFCKPNYNSFVSTFSWKLVHSETPEVIKDSSVNLIYVSSLCNFIIRKILSVAGLDRGVVQQCEVPYDFQANVTEILDSLNRFKLQYFDAGIIPFLPDSNSINLFNTFRSYIDYEKKFPRKLKTNVDERGVFVELLRLGVGGQVSFSTTKKNIMRGNHCHTRKIERFTVIKGKACIQLRRIGSSEIFNFILDGVEPSYVDIPIWYTHNIKNIGDDDLYTLFWINEWYDESDPDTYFEKV